MNKIKIAPKIDFADSEFKSYEMSDRNLTIYIIAWNAKTIKIKFSHCIQISYKLGGVIDNLYQVMDETNFLKEALSHYYEKVEDSYPFKLFQIQDIDDFPFIEVVAESVLVEKITP